MYIDFCPILLYYVRMSPRDMKPTIKDYRPILSIEARDALTELAAGLGFIVTRPGTYYGKPSTPAMLDALAAAYATDPGGVHLALKVIGVYNKPDATPPADE